MPLDYEVSCEIYVIILQISIDYYNNNLAQSVNVENVCKCIGVKVKKKHLQNLQKYIYKVHQNPKCSKPFTT